MKKGYRHIVIVAALIILATSALFRANGQDMRSAYFIDDYIYSYRLNPAFQTKKNFAGTLFSTIHAGSNSNVGLSTFIYPYGDQLVNFMHKSVSAEEFLSKLNKINRLCVNIDYNIASVGFWGKYKGEDIFQTYEINWRNNTSAKIPFQVFNFLKGRNDDSFFYDLSNVRVLTSSYLEFAGGVSKRSGDFTWGIRGKFLLGMNKISAHIKHMYANLNGLYWSMSSDANIKAAGGGIKRVLKESAIGKYNVLDFKSIKFKPLGLGGAGLAIDLGARYKINDYINISAAANDLGAIFWKDKATGVSSRDLWIFEGIDNLNNIGDIGNVVNDIIANFKSIQEFKAERNRISTQRLSTTINVGAEFVMPFYNKMSVGVLGSARLHSVNPYQELRLSVNTTPLKWLSASINTAYSTYGWEVGGMVNIYAQKFSLFIGTDSYYFNMTKQFIPTHEFNTQVICGVSYLFGKEH